MLRLPSAFLLAVSLLAAPAAGHAQYEDEGPLGLATPPQSHAPARPLPSPNEAANAYARHDAYPTPLLPPDGSPISLRMDMLDGQLSSLGARRTSGVGDGVVTMLLGGTYIGLGVYANRNDAHQIATFFYISGAGSLASAAVHFGLQPNAERAYTLFQSIRDDASLTPAARLRASENILHSMAKRRTAARYIQATLNLGITVGSLPILLGNDGFASSSGYDWLILGSASIGVVSAITTMFQRSEEERRWRMYNQFADRHPLDGINSDTGPRLRLDTFAISPMPAGGNAFVRFVF